MGGTGGRSGLSPSWGGTINSEAGQSSTYGVGGVAVNRNTDGANASGYSAGGGGAGGDAYDLFDNVLGYAGKGGRKGVETTFVVDTSAYTASEIIVELDAAGAGGAVGTLGNYQGGAGVGGLAVVQTPIGATTEYELGNLLYKLPSVAFQELGASDPATTYTWTGLSAYQVVSVEFLMTLNVASSVVIQARKTGGTWRTLGTFSTGTADHTMFVNMNIMYFNSTHRKIMHTKQLDMSNNDTGTWNGAGTDVSEHFAPWNATGSNELFDELRVTTPNLDAINGDTWDTYIRIGGLVSAKKQFPWSNAE